MEDTLPGNNPASRDDWQTHESLFQRLRAPDAGIRHIAWDRFRERYAPVIAGFARNLGAKPQDLDDVIQDVFLGFFIASPNFVYDRSKGRFRGYLKIITLNAIRSRFGERARVKTIPITEISDDAQPIAESWEESWQQNLLRLAIASVRELHANHPKTFEAFELYVLRGQPVADVAKKLQMSPDSVYQAKSRIMQQIRQYVHQLDQED